MKAATKVQSLMRGRKDIPPELLVEFYDEAREELRKWAVKYTCRCTIQEGVNGRPWPCGSCFCDLLGCIGIAETGEHNDPVDRTNEVWRAVLQCRDVPDGLTHEQVREHVKKVAEEDARVRKARAKQGS